MSAVTTERALPVVEEGAPVTRATKVHAGIHRRRPVLQVLRYAILLLALAFFLFPIVWVCLTSIKLPGEYMHRPPVWWPENPTTNHYHLVMNNKGWTALRNSVAIATTATLFSLAIGTLAAYSLVRFKTGGKHLAFWILSQRMMPPVVMVVPFFLLLRDLGKIDPRIGLDTRVALIALYTVFNLPFVVWMMRSYFEGVPAELEESALVDGSTRLGVFWRITLPLSFPGLIATGTFAFIFSWTEFLFAVVITRTNSFTLPVAIAGFSGSQGSNWGQASALAVVATAPVFALGLLVQRHFVRGLTLGAVRG
ncbi:MAG: multiple sugar transport system permease protein [Thermomicrobiales bacterium]|nr:multiple sugar transport system permease protein [Thermomicrobiales bacterium]